MTQFLQKLGLN